ncbi:hypothetical protein CG736_12540 [Kitasatospora sp. CB02891]|nr:hypothetical protein CG736_12540 [Kitasatospora sp. CB02891]
MPTADTTTTADERAVRITGGRRLVGTTTVQGSKNIALHLYAAAILADEPLTLLGAPEILDTAVVADILRRTGTRATVTHREFATRPAGSCLPVVPDDLGRRIRTTAVLGGALLARAGEVTFPTPGGDAFCVRRIDRHLAAMEAAGAEVEVGRGRVRARLTGKRLPFNTDAETRSWGPSLGATVTAMLLAARTPGTSTIRNPSVEPEVTHTAALLSQAGVGIEWRGRKALHITGVDSPSRRTDWKPPPSRWPPSSPEARSTWTASRRPRSRTAWCRCSPMPESGSTRWTAERSSAARPGRDRYSWPPARIRASRPTCSHS